MSAATSLRAFVSACASDDPIEQNGRGNLVTRGLLVNGERYLFDFRLCTPEQGWRQFDTTQDAPYFGVWVHCDERCTFTYCEGDWTFVQCADADAFRAELESMSECYGPQPPYAVTIDADGHVTHYFDMRPTGE